MTDTAKEPAREQRRSQVAEALSNLLHEERTFPPSEEFAAAAVAKADLYDEAAKDRLAFWAKQARPAGLGDEVGPTCSTGEPPFAKWFVGGTLNVARTTASTGTSTPATATGSRFHWEGEPGDTRTITYAELKDEVCRAANALTDLGVEAGDRVAIYLPMIPEAMVAMLACARIGAPHSVVFGGFSADALASPHRRRRAPRSSSPPTAATGAAAPTRAQAGRRRGAARCPRARASTTSSSCAGPSRTSRGRTAATCGGTTSSPGRATEHEPQAFDSEHPLFILYTSGTTGKPKGILHTSGGYLTQCAYTHRNVFDLKPETDVYWCTADIGWVTGHSYIVYGPLANGATQVMYEGTPDTPHKGRWWELIAKYGVTILYTAPTAIRTFMKWGEELPNEHDLSSLRLLGSVGEPINPEAWIWYRRVIGGDRAPIVDTWWQTETGAIMISPLPGVTATKPGSAMTPLPGISADVVDDEAKPVPDGGGGYLVLTEPWPSMLRGIWGDDRAVQGDLLVAVRGPLLRRRRRQEGRGRRHLAARPGRRRDARVRAQHLDDRGRVGAGVAPQGRGGRRRRRHRPDHGPGHRARSSSCAATRPPRWRTTPRPARR